MPSLGFVPGGQNLDVTDVNNFGKEMGQFAPAPGSTPKYAYNLGRRDAEQRESLARMFLDMPEQERDLFVQSCPPETRELARVLCGVDSGGTNGTGFVDFMITQINEPFSEKVQVVETLSDNFIIYTFGQAAPQFTYSGYLYNTYQDDQRVWMMRVYRDIIRATQLARRRKLVRLRYDSVIVAGAAIMHTQSLQGDAQNYVQFSLNIIPTEYSIYTPAIGTPTKLLTPATLAGKVGISNASAVPDTNQRQTTATQPEPSVWDRLANTFVGTRQRVNQQNPIPFTPTNTAKPKKTAAQVLQERLIMQQVAEESPDVMGGILSQLRDRLGPNAVEAGAIARSFPTGGTALTAAQREILLRVQSESR